jgi:hypothetical protein
MRLAEDIHNYYEKLVLDYFDSLKLNDKFDVEYMADLTCLVLNQLPPRYIRHEVDMSFYLPASERFEMESKVKVAYSKAKEFMQAHEKE